MKWVMLNRITREFKNYLNAHCKAAIFLWQRSTEKKYKFKGICKQWGIHIDVIGYKKEKQKKSKYYGKWPTSLPQKPCSDKQRWRWAGFIGPFKLQRGQFNWSKISVWWKCLPRQSRPELSSCLRTWTIRNRMKIVNLPPFLILSNKVEKCLVIRFVCLSVCLSTF